MRNDPVRGTAQSAAQNVERNDMKKRAKAKAAKTDMLDLVTAMMKLVERLEVLEKKTDLVLGRVSNPPSEMRQAVQDFQRPDHGPQQNHGLAHGQPNEHRERVLHKAVCADCRKGCEVPFKPSGDRPVYCPECFAIRKAGHVPKDLTAHVVVPHHLRGIKTVPGGAGKAAVSPKRKKPASKAVQKPAKKKKK